MSDQEEYEGEQVYTLQAIYVLNECLAQIIDLVYGSEEKEKANAIIGKVMFRGGAVETLSVSNFFGFKLFSVSPFSTIIEQPLSSTIIGLTTPLASAPDL